MAEHVGDGTHTESSDAPPQAGGALTSGRLALFADLSMLAAVDRDADRYTFAGGASIYPFAWSVLLAAHDEGLGGVITTIAIRDEEQVKALLGAPDQMALAAVIVLGYPVRRPTRLRRQPVASFASVDSIDGPAFGPL